MKNETEALKARIRDLKEKRDTDLKLLRAQFHIAQESLKPFNIIKSTIKELTSSSELKHNILGNVLGIGTAVLSNKLLVGNSHNPIKKFIGTLLQFAVRNVISKHTKSVKSKIGQFIHFYMKRKNESKIDFQDVQNMDELKELSNKNKVIQKGRS